MWLDNKKALTSILGIFVCIVCLCSTTFAWFITSRWGIYTRDSDVTNGEQLLLP